MQLKFRVNVELEDLLEVPFFQLLVTPGSTNRRSHFKTITLFKGKVWEANGFDFSRQTMELTLKVKESVGQKAQSKIYSLAHEGELGPVLPEGKIINIFIEYQSAGGGGFGTGEKTDPITSKKKTTKGTTSDPDPGDLD